MKKLFYFLSLLFIVACARMGQPDGGWYDDDPPRVIGSTPADRGTNVKTQKVTIYFDEFIKIEDATNKVIVSPPQLEMPEINGAGKKIVVELKDSLKENTTYTIDFSDAISDNNEGNPMGSFTFSFSTGEKIDTFEVSGYVVDASNLEPVKGILVGLYNDLADSAFKSKPMVRVSRTDASGHFVVRGIAPGSYRAYALKDVDGDFKYSQKSEMIAFNHDTFEPSSKPDMRTDTIWRDTLHIDALIKVPYTHFLPDDITLLAFTPVQTDRYLIKTERTDPNKFSVYFSYGNAELPKIKGLNFDADSAFVVETNLKQDTIHYWLRDTLLVNQDTLRMEMRYLMTDSAGVLIEQTDTLEALPKMSYEKRMKEKAKEIEKWQKEQEKKKKKEEPYDSIYPIKPLEPRFDMPTAMDPDKRAFVEMPVPLMHCDTSAVHLYSKIDTLWYESPIEMLPVEGSIRRYELKAEWRPDTEYSLEVDSAAFVSIYGLVSNAFKQGVKVKSLDEYSTLKISISGVTATDSAIVVQLLSSSGALTKETRVHNGVAQFDYVNPGKYYLSAFVDANGNGIWDTGDYDADRQPEDVFFYPKEIECKEKWDIKRNWNLTATPRFRQKPQAIVKEKPEQKKKIQNRNAQRAKDLGIEYLKGKGVNVK